MNCYLCRETCPEMIQKNLKGQGLRPFCLPCWNDIKSKTQTKILNSDDYYLSHCKSFYRLKAENREDRYTTDAGLPYTICMGCNGKLRYIDDRGIEYYVQFKK
jgi:hypothetical protein